MTFYPSFALDMIESRHEELLREAATERRLHEASATRPAYNRAARRPLVDRLRALTNSAATLPRIHPSGTAH